MQRDQMDELRINRRSTGKPQGKRSFGGLMHKLEDSITMNLTERECKSMEHFQTAQYSV